MKKKKVEIIFASILGAVLLIGIIKISLLPNKKLTKQTPAVVPKTMGVSYTSKNIIDKKLIRIKSEAEKIGWERNPFIRSKIPGRPVTLSLNLAGIIWDEQNPHAIISDNLVKEGDVIGKYKIIKVNKDSVVISSDEGQKTLHIWEEEE